MDPHETGAHSLLSRNLFLRVVLRILMFEWFAAYALAVTAGAVLVGVLLRDWALTALAAAGATLMWGFVVYDEARDRQAERDAAR